MTIERLDAAGVERELEPLSALHADVVNGGASVGFVPPIGLEEARAYWREMAGAAGAGSRVVFVARAPGLLGTVQLALESRANGRHRAELARLLVHPSARRRGLGRALALAAEDEARAQGRRTLHLDTRLGDPAEGLYRSLGWTFVGSIPDYAAGPGGELEPNAIYYKLL